MKTSATELDVIDHAAHTYSQARKLLGDRSAHCKAEIERVIKSHRADIREAASLAAQAEAQLRERIEANPELFNKPRTMTLHGIKLGYQKGKGRIQYQDAGKVCELIRKHLPDEADALIQSVETPIKAALLNLEVATLRKLGCTVTGIDDTVLIKDSAGDVDKMVAKLIVEFNKDADGGAKS